MKRLIFYIILLISVSLASCSKDSSNDRLLWSFKTDDVTPTCPTIAPDGTIYIGSHDNYLYSINKDGKMNWRFKTGDFVHGSPALDSDGNIYFFTDWLGGLVCFLGCSSALAE